MGRDKLLLEYQGKTLMQRAIDLLYALPVFERIVVTSDVRLNNISLPQGINVQINKRPEDGISSSIHIGLIAATGSHFLFMNADQPKLTIADIEKLLSTSKANPDKIVFPVFDSVPNSPTIFPKRFRAELLNLTGDYGGRVVRDAHSELCMAIKPEYPANFEDIDNKEEYLDLFQR